MIPALQVYLINLNYDIWHPFLLCNSILSSVVGMPVCVGN